MVSSNTIENCNSLSKRIEIFNGLLKFIAISSGFLNLEWIFVNRYREMFWVLFSELMILLSIILSPMLRNNCKFKFYQESNLHIFCCNENHCWPFAL